MTTYVDIETSREALQEDEELIEAVSELVGTVSTTVKAEIEWEVTNLLHTCQSTVEDYIPILTDYRNDPQRLREDVYHFGIFSAYVLVAVWVLTPRRRQADHRSRHRRHRSHTAMAANSHTHSTAPLLSRSFAAFGSSSNNSDHGSEDSELDLQNTPHNSCHTFMDEETDEDRFAKNYAGMIAESGYRRLVLPPQCRIIRTAFEKRELERQASVPKPTRVSATTSAATVSTNSNNATTHEAEEDENPVARLSYYFQQLWIFLHSIVWYDYTAAGRTLMEWLSGIYRIQHNQRTASTDGLDQCDTSTIDGTPSIDAFEAMDASVDGATSAMVLENHNKKTKSDISMIQEVEEASTEASGSGPAHGGLSPRSSLTPTQSSLRSPMPPTASITDLGTSIISPLPEISHPEDEVSHGDDVDDVICTAAHMPLRETRSNSLEFPHIHALSMSKNGRQSDGSIYFDPAISLVPSKSMDKSNGTTTTSSTSETPLSRAAIIGQKYRDRDDPTEEKTTLASDFFSPMASVNSGLDAPSNDSKAYGENVDIDTPGSEAPTLGSHRHFFDTANSDTSLKQMSVDLPVPDKHGYYCLGDEFLPDRSRYTPLLVFVNSRSGPQQGQLLITQLRRLLNPIQVWDLADGGPRAALESFLVLSRLRVLVCGGDGTVAWIINTLEEMDLSRCKWPPIAILPLGTGNDLARIHGWGGGYNNESLITILEQISESYSSLLDRWEVTIHEKTKGKRRVKKESKSFFNYLGVGADAQAALQVHYLRESRPEWFFSRMVNKAMYGVFGAEDIIKATTVNVRRDIKLIADGVEIPLPPDSQGIIVLNIDAYAGGVPLWSHGAKVPRRPMPRRTRSMSEIGEKAFRRRMDSMDRIDSVDDMHNMNLSTEDRFDNVTACDMPSSCQDGMLDIVSIRGAFHLGQIKVGLSNAQRLCQCREVTIMIRNKVAVQVDGEPWRQSSCSLNIKRKRDPAVMLHRSADDGGVETEMSKLLDWAEERKMIDNQVHTILMKEFSRRIESKTRQRRTRNQDNLMSTLKKAISSGTMANFSNHESSGHWQDSGTRSPPLAF